jgi:hypothetical protein
MFSEGVEPLRWRVRSMAVLERLCSLEIIEEV